MRALSTLPKGIQRKITLVPEDASEATACWVWTGRVQPPRRRFKPYRIPEDKERNWNTVASFVNDRETPMVRSPELGYAIAAHRHLKAICEEIPAGGLPRLSRCTNTRCVSPYHTLATTVEVPKSARGRTRGGAPVDDYLPEADAPPRAVSVDLLRERDIAAWLGHESAEAELGIAIPPEIWTAYVAVCASDDDDED